MSRKIVLFEPWGLGDLAISLGLARNAASQGFSVTLLCDPRYVDWARDFPYLNAVHGISVPWTRKKGKYRLQSYPWKEWQALRKTLRNDHFEFAIEPRRDPRAAALLSFLDAGPKMRPSSRSDGLGYRRLSLLSGPGTMPRFPKDPSIVFFFGAEWKNRRVPEWKISSLLPTLLDSRFPVGVIIPPEEKDSEFYRSLRKTHLKCIEGSVVEVASQVKSYTHCVSTDSGWLHVAHLYGLRTLGLYGFSNDREWNPPTAAALRSEHCLPGEMRYSAACEDLQPLGTLREGDLSQALVTLLANAI